MHISLASETVGPCFAKKGRRIPHERSTRQVLGLASCVHLQADAEACQREGRNVPCSEPDAEWFTLLGRSNSAAPETLVSPHSPCTHFRRLSVNQFVVQPLVIPLVMGVGDKLRDRSSMVALAERNQAVQTFLFDRADEPFGVGVGVSRQLHRRRTVRCKPFELPIPSIRCGGASFNSSSVVRRGGSTASIFRMTQDTSPGSRGSGPIWSPTIQP